MQEEQALIPIEQQTIMFYGKPIIVVRLPDGRPGVVLRYLCDNLQLDSGAQVARVKRTEAIAEDLVYMQVQTDGGPQIMPTLVLHAVPFWLAGIDPKRVREEVKPDVIHYQREVVDVLYTWASSLRTIAAPTNLVPSEPITEPTRPAPDATLAEWHEYHLRMAAVLEWQMEVENWRGSIEGRLEGLEAIIPDILDRLPPPTLSPEHQSQVRTFVNQLHEATGKPHGTVWNEFKTAFAVAKYEQVPEEEWNKVTNWFRVQLQRVKKK